MPGSARCSSALCLYVVTFTSMVTWMSVFFFRSDLQKLNTLLFAQTCVSVNIPKHLIFTNNMWQGVGALIHIIIFIDWEANSRNQTIKYKISFYSLNHDAKSLICDAWKHDFVTSWKCHICDSMGEMSRSWHRSDHVCVTDTNGWSVIYCHLLVKVVYW